MNEITRIHLAKTPYNIETAAYATLNDYLRAIEKALHADIDTMREIESRMTELLSERGVGGDSVITETDVVALQKQLGDPKDFAGDDAEENKTVTPGARKRLMRDPSNAMLGGVCSGIAAYFGWDAVWVRVAAVILVFITSGVMIPIYIILLIVMPEAKTAADRLEMTGAPVTLETLKQTATASIERAEPMLVKIFRIVLGVGLIFGAIAAMIAVIAGVVFAGIRPNIADLFGTSFNMWVSIGFMALGGVMLAIFCGILAHMTLRKSAERGLIIALVIAAIIGIGSFGAGVAMPISRQVTMQGKLATTNTTERLEVDLAGVTALKTASSNLNVHYTVSDTHREATVRYNNLMVKNPDISFTRQDNMLVVHGTFTRGTICSGTFDFCDDRPLELYITGPSLDTILATGSDVRYETTSQDSLIVEQDDTTAVGVTSRGRIDTLSVKSTGGSFSATDATISTVSLDTLRGDSTFANIDVLNVTAQTSSCSTIATVNANSAATVKVNGQEWQPSTVYPCLGIQIFDRG